MQRLRWTISSAQACIGRCSSRPPAVIQARLLIPCDGILRRGRLGPAKEQADAAIVCLGLVQRLAQASSRPVTAT
ncbi:MAG: hypothetical protein JO023_22840 [Chloroflexi bacterium]|nr:hypothetical protein [Chloroflexota bacterium]